MSRIILHVKENRQARENVIIIEYNIKCGCNELGKDS